MPTEIQGWVNILSYNILTHPSPSPPLSYPLKSQIGRHLMKMFLWRIHDNRNCFTLLLAIYYDCLVKVMGGSIYYGIIFWCPPPPTHPPYTHTHTHTLIPHKKQIGHHFIKMLFFSGLNDKRKHFTLFKGIIYYCLLKPKGGSKYYGIIFWPPTLPPPYPLKSQVGHYLMKMFL